MEYQDFNINFYIYFLLFITREMITNKRVFFYLSFIILISYFFYENFLSIKRQNEKFFNRFYTLVEKNLILDRVIHERFYKFTGDDIEASNFFVQIGDIARQIAIKYHNQYEIYQIVINEKPSGVFQINGDEKNDKNIYNTFISKSEKIKNQRFSTTLRRKFNTDIILQNSASKAISVYCKEGVNQDTFEENIKKFNNKMIGIKVNCEELSNQENRGQIWIIKDKKTKAFLMFRESAGEQAHDVGTRKSNKYLIYDGFFKNKSEFAKYQKGEVVALLNKLNIYNKIF